MPKKSTKKSTKKSDKKNKNKSKKNEDIKEEEKPKADLHPGYICLYLGDKELQGYGFKTGDGLLDVCPAKMLSKNNIIEEIKFKGKMCAFEPFRIEIEKYENDNILFVWDPDEKMQSDCNFYFCINQETFNCEKEKFGFNDDGTILDPEELKQKQKEEELRKKQEEIEKEKKLEEERIQKEIEKLKQPLTIRKWIDLGSYNEIITNKESLKPNRKKLNILIGKKRRQFGNNKVQFSDQDNIDGMNVEIKSLKQLSKSYDIYKILIDKSNQCTNKMYNKYVQTKWNRKLNKIIQYQFNDGCIQTDQRNDDGEYYIDYNEQDNDDYTDNIIDLNKLRNNNNNNHNDDHDDEEDENDKLISFLDDIYDELNDMLTDNELVNIFEDDFKLFQNKDNETGLDTKTENIKEIGTFVDLNWSRNKKISEIHWMPSADSNNNMIAVSCIESMPFDERVNIMNKSRISTILLWNLSHVLLKAQIILTAPTDIFTFKFHPFNKNIIIGGLETGQVILWNLDLDNKDITNDNKDNQENDDDDDDDDNDDDDDATIPKIAPSMLSYIEKSHTKSVTDLLWLPQDIIIAPNGELKYIQNKNQTKSLSEEQFMSIASDGMILYWNIQKPKQTEKEKKKNESSKWIPICSKVINKSKLNENIFVDKESMDIINYDDILQQKQNNDSDDDKDDDNSDNNNNNKSDTIFACKMCYTPLLGKICIGTELGEYGLYNYGLINSELINERNSLLLNEYMSSNNNEEKDEKEKEKDSNNNNNDDEVNEKEELLHSILLSSISNKLHSEHTLDIKSIIISPHFNNIYLTISDWRFCIWRNNKLIFVSPYSSTYVTCGMWSPTRPSVIITAKKDGTIDIWDLLDETNCPIISNSPISSTSITSIKFSPYCTHQLAIGDLNGNLRILEIPRNFVLPLNNEKLLMFKFYNREYKKIKFINKRYKKHREIYEKQQKEKEEREKEKKNNNNEQNQNINENKDNLNINIENEQDKNDKKLEAKYQNMLVAFKKKLGIKIEE